MKGSFAKIAVSVILTFAMLVGAAFLTPVGAAQIEDETVSPLWVGISSVNVDMSFSGNNGNAIGTLTKSSTASSMEATLTVYRWSGSQWVFVDSASGTKTRGTLALSISFDAVAGTRYKAVFDVTVYTNNVPESESIDVEKTCPTP
ncbi:MAG: hypothetical protein IJX46_08785 [Clostridia bacterium]|nr:hypothetical protein [Clostridia bacterium]